MILFSKGKTKNNNNNILILMKNNDCLLSDIQNLYNAVSDWLIQKNPGRFAPKPFPPLVVSPPGRFPPSRFAPLVVSPPSRFAPTIYMEEGNGEFAINQQLIYNSPYTRKPPLCLGLVHTTFNRTVVKIFKGAWLVVLRLNVPVNNFSVISGRSHHFLGN